MLTTKFHIASISLLTAGVVVLAGLQYKTIQQMNKLKTEPVVVHTVVPMTVTPATPSATLTPTKVVVTPVKYNYLRK